ncbi:MAG: UDP-N-acetylmuramate dehydrogenase, partial [Sciscionella sp.]
MPQRLPLLLVTGPSISIQATNEVALRDYTTLRLGGPAARLVSARDEEAIVSAVRAADSADTPLLVLGGGSNLVISDAGFAGTCVLVANTGTTIERSGDGEVVVTAEAGTDWDEFVAHTVAEGLGGLECLSGIPGLVGACPVQNIGAYGVEIAQLLLSVDLLERASGTVRTVPAAELGLGFRVSVLKDTEHAVVLRARFRLRTDGRSAPIRFAELARTLGVAIGERVPVAAARQAVLGLRRSKGMVLDET